MWQNGKDMEQGVKSRLSEAKLAERGGFEPPVRFDPYDGLANRSFRPLRHLSGKAVKLWSQREFDYIPPDGKIKGGRLKSSHLR
jgi:hypothetical protein